MFRSRLTRPTLGNRINIIYPSNRRLFSIEPIIEVLKHGTEMLQQIHTDSGLPWYIFIPLTTVSMRTVFTLPIAVYQRKGLQKQNELRPIVSAMTPVLRVKLAAAIQAEQVKIQKTQNSSPLLNEKAVLSADKIIILAAKQKYKMQRKLFKEYGCQTWKMMLLPAIQIPLWVSLSYMFRLLTGWGDFGTKSLIDTSLTHEHFLHLYDLSVSDPYFILPVTLGVVALSNAEWNFKTADLMKLTTRGKKDNLRPTAFDVIITLSRASLIFLVAVSTQAPAALVMYWISSNFYSLTQNLVLDKFLPLRYTPYERFKRSGTVHKTAAPLVKYN